VSDQPAEIRAADVGDAAAIAAVYAPHVESSVVSFEEVAPDADEMRRRMLAAPRLPWYVAIRSGDVVGYCYASHHKTRAAYRWSVDVSVYLAASEHRRGTGRRLYETLLPELAALGYVNAYAGVTLPNPASVGLHEAMGFTPVGVYTGVGFKQGSWHDVGWCQRALTERPAHPDEPRPWSPGAS
jgi:phosphinothricin acetyltransferase